MGRAWHAFFPRFCRLLRFGEPLLHPRLLRGEIRLAGDHVRDTGRFFRLGTVGAGTPGGPVLPRSTTSQ